MSGIKDVPCGNFFSINLCYYRLYTLKLNAGCVPLTPALLTFCRSRVRRERSSLWLRTMVRHAVRCACAYCARNSVALGVVAPAALAAPSSHDVPQHAYGSSSIPAITTATGTGMTPCMQEGPSSERHDSRHARICLLHGRRSDEPQHASCALQQLSAHEPSVGPCSVQLRLEGVHALPETAAHSGVASASHHVGPQ